MVVNAPLLGTSGGGCGRRGRAMGEARDRTMGYVGEAVDD